MVPAKNSNETTAITVSERQIITSAAKSDMLGDYVSSDDVREPTATVLERALETEVLILALSIEDRERILRALDDPPEGLAELRGVLLREHEWRKREGLV